MISKCFHLSRQQPLLSLACRLASTAPGRRVKRDQKARSIKSLDLIGEKSA
jgi:hypothetical protein